MINLIFNNNIIKINQYINDNYKSYKKYFFYEKIENDFDDLIIILRLKTKMNIQ